MLRKTFATMLSLVALAGLVAPSQAADSDKRLQALENQVTVMEKTRSTNNQQIASALSRFGTLQDEFTSLKGDIQTNKHLISSQYQDLTKRLVDMDHRIQSIEDRMSIFATQLSLALGKIAPATAAEGDLYQKGLDQVSNSRYLEAAATFETFIKKYPKSKFVQNAKFWIAECFYSMRDYQRAIKEYQNYVEKYPRSDKVAEAILKQGNSFYELGMMDEATAFYDKVAVTYATSPAAAEAKERLARIQNKKTQSTHQPGAAPGTYPTQTLQQVQNGEKSKGF